MKIFLQIISHHGQIILDYSYGPIHANMSGVDYQVIIVQLLPVTSRVISVIIAAFPVYPLDILQYLFLIVKILFPDSCLPHFDVCIQIDAEQSLHSVQDC